VLYAVALQELARWGTYAAHVQLMHGLRSVGLMPETDKHRAAAQIVPAAVAAGLGAGVMHGLVMRGDVLAGALRPGTLYTPACSTLSLFAVDALTNLAFVVLNVLLSILGWTAAYPRKALRVWAAILGLHLLAAYCTMLNSRLPLAHGRIDGCALSLPCLYAVVLATTVLTARVAAGSISPRGGVDAPAATLAQPGESAELQGCASPPER